ncbi:GDSL family lipase [Paenibacillus sp. F411]|uniref:SGNH/GDSL hydrolase family protein n=1 Tax=Paenibacillus sp. F411 TaxID=2820239 RepID=UPI001AAEBCA2|nr:SGNH/GDSL hydrolase family protein [Paenibacillus sp. F411]MBO2943750.1 GDSL family lipase [Paenibacillus sp. F411]
MKLKGTELDYQGAVSVESTPAGAKPWRIPYEQQELFLPKSLLRQTEVPAGVRITFKSDSRTAVLHVEGSDVERTIDCVVDGKLHQSVDMTPNQEVCRFDNLPENSSRVELFLPQKKGPLIVRELELDHGASYSHIEDNRLRWISYGSSITQCEEASGPSRTWPALVANHFDWHSTNLGYSGNCHLEMMVARMIRELPADLISICAGINIMGVSSMSERTFQAALIGFVQVVREKHPHTPIILQSPIFAEKESRETHPNKVDLTLQIMRTIVRETVEVMQGQGDNNLYYLDGLEVFGEEWKDSFPDKLHPDAEGYVNMSKQMIQLIEKLGLGTQLKPTAVI